MHYCYAKATFQEEQLMELTVKEWTPTPLFFFTANNLSVSTFMKIKTTLRKHAYSNKVNILTTKKWKFSDKNSDIYHTSGQIIDCGYSLEPPRRGGSNEYPQSMFLGWNKKNNVYPCKPQFYYIKVRFNGVNII